MHSAPSTSAFDAGPAIISTVITPLAWFSHFPPTATTTAATPTTAAAAVQLCPATLITFLTPPASCLPPSHACSDYYGRDPYYGGGYGGGYGGYDARSGGYDSRSGGYGGGYGGSAPAADSRGGGGYGGAAGGGGYGPDRSAPRSYASAPRSGPYERR